MNLVWLRHVLKDPQQIRNSEIHFAPDMSEKSEAMIFPCDTIASFSSYQEIQARVELLVKELSLNCAFFNFTISSWTAVYFYHGYHQIVNKSTALSVS